MGGVLLAVAAATALAACGGGDDTGGEDTARADTASTAATTTAGAPTITGADAAKLGDVVWLTDDGGGYIATTLENVGGGTLADVEVTFDLLDAAGTVLGAAEPARLRRVPTGVTAAVAASVTPQECACDTTKVASATARVDVGFSDGPSDPSSVALATDVALAGTGADLTVTATVTNPSDVLPLSATDRAQYVLLDAQGKVLGGSGAVLGTEVPAEGSAAVTLEPLPDVLSALKGTPASALVWVD